MAKKFIIHKWMLSIDWIDNVKYGIIINQVDLLLFWWINTLYL